MKTILHKCALNFWLLPAPARVFISKLQNRFSVFSFYVLLLFLLSTGKTSLFWEETQYTRGKMWQGFWPRFKDWDDICQFLIFFSFAFQSVPRWLCECIYLENVCIEGLLPTGRRWWSWIPLWLGGELRSLCRQQWMALSEGSARWQADLLRIHPERRDESDRGASKGVREAVCVCVGEGDAVRPVQWPHSAWVKSATDVPFSKWFDAGALLLRGSTLGMYSVWLRRIRYVDGKLKQHRPTAQQTHLRAKLYIWWVGRISLGLRTAVEPIVFCRLSDLPTLTANSTPIKSGQTSPWALADKVKKWLLISEWRSITLFRWHWIKAQLESWSQSFCTVICSPQAWKESFALLCAHL